MHQYRFLSGTDPSDDKRDGGGAGLVLICFLQEAADKAHATEIAAAVAKAVADERAAAASTAAAEKVCAQILTHCVHAVETV